MTEQEYLSQARDFAGREQYGRAIDLLEEAVASGNESSGICKELARLSLTVNEVRAFANWCHEAMRIDPTDPEPFLMIARVLVAARRWEEAVETLGHAIGTGRLTGDSLAEAERLLADSRRGE